MREQKPSEEVRDLFLTGAGVRAEIRDSGVYRSRRAGEGPRRTESVEFLGEPGAGERRARNRRVDLEEAARGGDAEGVGVVSSARAVARVRREAAGCRRCPLWRDATRTVFGEGTTGGLMLVGEQPGDVEDREGRPFVGPGGRLLRELLGESGIPPERTYLTNAVKHFKWHASGKRRIHDRPKWLELDACNHWLQLELAAVSPALVVCLGATAAQALRALGTCGRAPRQASDARGRDAGTRHRPPIRRAQGRGETRRGARKPPRRPRARPRPARRARGQRRRRAASTA